MHFPSNLWSERPIPGVTMRKSIAGVIWIATFVAACGGFGSEDEEQQGQPPPPSTPDENSKPPPDVPGKPIEGIYVSAKQGKPGATGYPGSPVNTIAEGMTIARDKKLRLIVCAEEYAENFEVLDGVSAYGYYDCSAPLWKRTNDHAKVRAPKSPAMIARDIKLPTRIEGFDVFAPDLDGTLAVDREGTSIGLDARNIPPGALIIGESVLHGGKAAPGSDGARAEQPSSSGPATGNPGIVETFASCPSPQFMNCTNPLLPGVDGPSITCGYGEPSPGPGGKGGDGVWFLDRTPNPHPSTELRGRPVSSGAIGSQFGTPCSNYPDDTCARGANGGNGAPGETGANGAWHFDANGFVLGDGVRGKSGEPGKGGQGGGSARSWYEGGFYTAVPAGVPWARSARGGSGGSGGCGGLAGGPGGGGGASIGVMAIDAAVTFERDIVESSNGGRAGKGTLGSLSMLGGEGGTGGAGAGSGGNGGAGGNGGGSGQGAAGPSIALVFKGVRPNVSTGVELRPGAGGEGRPPLSILPESPVLVPAAPLGAALVEYEIKP